MPSKKPILTTFSSAPVNLKAALNNPMSRNKKPKRFLVEEVLDFLKHNDSKTFNYKQLGAAMEIDAEAERFMLIETLEELSRQGFVIEKEKGKYQIKETKQYVTGTIDFTSQG